MCKVEKTYASHLFQLQHNVDAGKKIKESK